MTRQPPAAERAASHGVRPGGGLSLEWRLPLLMTASLAAGVAALRRRPE